MILVPSKKSSKKHAVASRKVVGTRKPPFKHATSKSARRPSSRAAGRSSSKAARRPRLKRSTPRILKPDINVRRSAYSKMARLAVLASAEARQKLIEVGGENTIDIIREFDRDMSDEELARKTGVKTSDVRVVLNRLHSCGLFTYTRVRDRDSGWYSYIWKMSEGRLREFADGAGVGSLNIEGGESAVEGDSYLQKNLIMPEEQMYDAAARRRR